MLHQPDVVEVILLRPEFVIRIDMEVVAGKAFDQVDAVPGADDLFEAFRHMMQRGTGLVFIPHLVKTHMDVLQHVGPHVAVQEHERVGRRLRHGKAHLVFRRQVRNIRAVVCVGHRNKPRFSAPRNNTPANLARRSADFI